jgi:IS5 family transposase
MKRTTFESLAWSRKGKVTRCERFLTEMNAVIPWQELTQLIEPDYPKAGSGTQPMSLQGMLRFNFMQHWFNLSDPGMEDALYDSESMRCFAGIEVAEDAAANESAILHFRRLIEHKQPSQKIFAQSRTLLEDNRVQLKAGAIVDATIIEAPTSTKNADGTRDPEIHQVPKGKDWHFEMKAHIGTDRRVIAHTLTVTAANVADINDKLKLLQDRRRKPLGVRPSGVTFIVREPRRRALATELSAAQLARYP